MLEELKEWFSVAALIVSLAGTAYAWVTSRSRVNSARIDNLETDVKAIGQKVQLLESDVSHLPDRETVNDIKLALSDLRGTVGNVATRLDGLGKTVDLIDQFIRKAP